MKIFLPIFMILLVSGSVRAGDSLTPKGFNFTPAQTLEALCQSAMVSLGDTAITPLKDDADLIQKFRSQFSQMVATGSISGAELQQAKIISVVATANKLTLHLIQVGEGTQEKYFYIIPAKRADKSSWGRLGTPQAMRDLGSIIPLENGKVIIQSETRYVINLKGMDYKRYSGRPDDLIRYFDMSRELAVPITMKPEMQYLVDVGILTFNRLQTAKFYGAQSLKTKKSLEVLELEQNGPGSKKIRIYFVEPRFSLSGRYLEFGPLNSVGAFEKFGDRLLRADGEVIKIEVPSLNDAPTGQNLLSEISQNADVTVPVTKIFQNTNVKAPREPLVMGPTDLDAYKIERLALQNLKPALNVESLASIHDFTAPLEDAVLALTHKKRALQKLVFDKVYWDVDSERIHQFITRIESKNSVSRQELEEVLVDILKTRRADLTRYLEYLSQIKSTSLIVEEKLKEFSGYLQGKSSENYSLELSEAQSFLNQYQGVAAGNSAAIQNEFGAVTQTINYFKQLNMLLAATSGNQEIDPQLLNDLKVLQKILSDLANKNMNGLYLTSGAGGVP